MNYFRHHTCQPMGKIWSLFSELSEANKLNPKENVSSSFEYTLELIKSASGGNIDLSDENLEAFSLVAYGIGCSKNEFFAEKGRYKKELFLVDSYESDDGGNSRIGFGDIPMDRVSTRDKNLEEIVESQAFEQTLLNLLGIRTDIIVNYQVDIVRSLERSLEGNKGAIKVVQDIVQKDDNIGQIITELCSTSCIDDLYERLKAVA